MNTVDPVLEIKAHIEAEFGGNQGRFARSIGFSPAYVSDVLTFKRPPSDRLLGILGLQRIVIKSGEAK